MSQLTAKLKKVADECTGAYKRIADYEEVANGLSALKRHYENEAEASRRKTHNLRCKQLAIISGLLQANLKEDDNLTFFLLDNIVNGINHSDFEKDRRTTITNEFVKERIRPILATLEIKVSINGNQLKPRCAVRYAPLRDGEYGLLYYTLTR